MPTGGLIRQRDKQHVDTIWLNRDVDYELEDRTTGERHVSLIAEANNGKLIA